MKRTSIRILVSVLPILILIGDEAASAQCLKISFNPKNRKTSVKEVGLKKGKCPKGTIATSVLTGPQGLQGPQGEKGDTGDAGAAGADGKLAIYGDGSGGALNITSNTTWTFTPPNSGNFQFTDCTIAAGIIPSITVSNMRPGGGGTGRLIQPGGSGGGSGGNVSNTNVSSTSQPGGIGRTLITLADPTSIL